ncbi:MAG: ketoacyl-ACP synthase III [Spirochaetaceae bacterium]|jgi:3-oxoacyl-[acyl-carrier-protein] synthase-3|nr:ketoacyl-ACP synthase III [Spirochaetaceae bacterium]
MVIKIAGTGRAVPSTRVSNKELAEQIDTSDEWIRSHTGIGARHIAPETISVSDLAVEAARGALKLAVERAEVGETDPEKLAETLDFIVLGTTTQDYYGCPPTCCLVQHQLGAKKAAAMDLAAACSSFIYSIETAAALLLADPRRKRALVIGAETLSRITNWNDRGTCVLFGDGAGAVFLEKQDGKQEEPGEAVSSGRRGLLRTILGADGSGWENLIIRRGGSRNPWKPGETVDIPPHVEMNGHAVYNFAVKVITETIEQFMEEESLTIHDIARIIPHQANARIIQAAGKRLKIPEEKFYLNMEEYANTSSASIPIALDELNRSGQLRRGDLIITVGFGGGLTYGGNLIRW